MSLLNLNLECPPTADPHKEIRQMRGISSMLGITVTAKINSVVMHVSPSDDIYRLVDFYDRTVTRRGLAPVPNVREGA